MTAAMVACAAALAGFSDRASGAEPDVELSARPHVRVLSEYARVYSGPGFGFRVIAVVERDDVMVMVERGKRGGWTRVRLDSGISGWVLSEQILVFGTEPGADERPGPMRRLGRKLRAKLLGPPNLLTARIGGALSAGALGNEGLFLVRPQVFLSPNVAIEGYVGPAVGRDSSRGLFGAAANIYLSPTIPFTLFVSVGGGGVHTRTKVDVLGASSWAVLLSPGGGAWIIFKHGVGIRFDFRNHVLFRADTAQSLQEYSGALAFTF